MSPPPPASRTAPPAAEIRCKRCTFRGSIHDFPLKLNGTDRTSACAACVYKNREEGRTKRLSAGLGRSRLSAASSSERNDSGDAQQGTLDHLHPEPTTLAAAVASTTTTPSASPSAIVHSEPSPPSVFAAVPSSSSSRKDKTRRNVGRSAFPEIQVTWHAFTLLVSAPLASREAIDVHAAVILRGVDMFDPFLPVQTDEGGEGGKYVLLEGKREKVDAAAWMLARLVAREIWRITGYRFIYKSRSGSTGNPTRHNSHFTCAQNDAEKRNKRSRVPVQKKRMPRFDCGGYLNIVTDERDLGTVNVVLTHLMGHVPYSERPEEVPLQETPWLVGLDERVGGGQGDRDEANRMEAGASAGRLSVPRETQEVVLGRRLQRPLQDHLPPSRSSQASPSLGPLPDSSTSGTLNMVLDPSLATNDDGFTFLSSDAAQPTAEASSTADATVAGPSHVVSPSRTPTTHSIHGDTEPRAPSALDGTQPLLATDQQTTLLISDMMANQTRQQRPPPREKSATASSSAATAERVHITPDEYLRYQQAYQVILSQLTSSRGMDARRYEKVGPMLQWIEQVAKIFESESQGRS